MPLQPELDDLRGFLASRGVTAAPDGLALTFRPRGCRVAVADDVVTVRSGSVSEDGTVVDDALLVVRPVPASGLRLLALDVETTGLVAGRDRIVSIGWVPVDGDRIDLAGARRHVVLGDDPGVEAADIHGLTRDDLAVGTPLPLVLAELREALAGRALLAHHATFDLGFVRAAFREVGERPPPVTVVCTLALQKRLIRADAPAEWPAGGLRLWVARDRFGMPAGRPHDALGDALACAELYLGQAAELRPATLRDVRLDLSWRTRVRRSWRRWSWRARRRVRAAVSASSR